MKNQNNISVQQNISVKQMKQISGYPEPIKSPTITAKAARAANKARVTSVTIDIETYGTENQRNATIKSLMESLLTQGYRAKLRSTKTLSSK